MAGSHDEKRGLVWSLVSWVAAILGGLVVGWIVAKIFGEAAAGIILGGVVFVVLLWFLSQRLGPPADDEAAQLPASAQRPRLSTLRRGAGGGSGGGSGACAGGACARGGRDQRTGARGGAGRGRGGAGGGGRRGAGAAAGPGGRRRSRRRSRAGRTISCGSRG